MCLCICERAYIQHTHTHINICPIVISDYTRDVHTIFRGLSQSFVGSSIVQLVAHVFTRVCVTVLSITYRPDSVADSSELINHHKHTHTHRVCKSVCILSGERAMLRWGFWSKSPQHSVTHIDSTGNVGIVRTLFIEDSISDGFRANICRVNACAYVYLHSHERISE